MDFLETDMFDPVRKYLEGCGYAVQGEVKRADIAAVKDDRLIIVELKKRFNLTLLYQALDRKKMTPMVYVAVPRPKEHRRANLSHMLGILKKLELGLLFVAMDSPGRFVETVLDASDGPVKKNKKAQATLTEMEERKLGGTSGGSTGKKLLTAYREKCILVACLLDGKDAMKTKDIAAQSGIDAKVCQRIFSSNVYGWYQKVEKGIYQLSPVGREMITGNEFREPVAYYKGTIDKYIPPKA